MPLAKLIRDTADAVVEAIGFEQRDVVVETAATRWQRETLVTVATGLWPVLRRYAACGQFLSVERSSAHHVQRSSEGAQVYAVQHLD